MKNLTEERLSTADFVSAGNRSETAGRPAETTSGQRPETTDGRSANGSAGTLLPENVVQDFRNQWATVQSNFVDEPQAAVRQADELVAVAMKRLAEGFTEQRNTLEHQWSGGKDVSTEDLRVALRKYRAFFERLLAIQAPVAEQ
jgi:hypothetical protein